MNEATFKPRINMKSRRMVQRSLSDHSKKFSASPAIDAYIRVGSDQEASPAHPVVNRQSNVMNSIARSRKSANSLEGTLKNNSTMRNNERVIDFRNV